MPVKNSHHEPVIELPGTPTDPLAPGLYDRPFRAQGRERSYLLRVPQGYDSSEPLAVVLVFHGGGTNANWLRRFCGLCHKADEARFLVVYPNGTGDRPRRLTWNCGERSGFERWAGGAEKAAQLKVDEVEFVHALLDDVGRLAKVDPAQVFVTGMSTGAIMAYYLAANMADRVASIAPIGGPLGDATCRPSRPVPILHFHGTDDDFAPYQGGKGNKSFTEVEFYSVPYTIDAWIEANLCEPEPQIIRLPSNTGNDTHVELSHYRPRSGGAEIKLYTIVGGGHTWPGQDPRMDWMGKYTRDIDANDLMWEFFQEHPLP